MEQFRCYAMKKGNRWVASCIDLNLVDCAETFDTVVDKLKENIQLYVGDKDPAVLRAAPFSYRFQYQWITLKIWIGNWFRKPSSQYYPFIERWDGFRLRAVGA